MADRATEARKELARRELARRGVSLSSESQPDPNAAPVEPIDPYKDRARRELDKMEGQGITAITAPSVRLPFNDNLAAFGGAIPRMISDGVGPVEAYDRQLAFEREKENRQREKNPVLQTMGDVAGGMAVGGAAAKHGLTMAGKIMPNASKVGKTAGTLGGLALEGRVYGGLAGIDNANGENVKEEFKRSANIGTIAGPAAYVIGRGAEKAVRGIAGAVKGKAAQAPASLVNSDASKALGKEASGLFSTAKAGGATLTPQGSTVLTKKMATVAGFKNKALRKKTAGMLKELDSYSGQPLTVERIHELRRTVQSSMAGAKPDDARTLSAMLDVVDEFIDNPPAGLFAGDPKALVALRQGIEKSHLKFKTERIEKIIDRADVQSEQFTQAGMANSLKKNFRQLYFNISDGKVRGFTPDEVTLIRALSKAENVDGMTKLIAKFAPRGAVSTGMGVIGGGLVGGPIGAAAPPMLGALAARGSDKAAISGAQSLKSMTSGVGMTPPSNFIPLTQKVRPALPAAVGGILANQ